MNDQLTLRDAIAGAALKEAGLSKVEQADHGFVAKMRAVAKDISLEAGFCTTDNLRLFADRLGWEPVHPNVWGSIIKGKGWRKIGYMVSKWPTNNGREIRIWKWEGGS